MNATRCISGGRRLTVLLVAVLFGLPNLCPAQGWLDSIADGPLGAFLAAGRRGERNHQRMLTVLAHEGAISRDEHGEWHVRNQGRLDEIYQNLREDPAGSLRSVPRMPQGDAMPSGQFWHNFLAGKQVYPPLDPPTAHDPFAFDSGMHSRVHLQLAAGHVDAAYAARAKELKISHHDVLNDEIRRGVAAGAHVYVEALKTIGGPYVGKTIDKAIESADLAKQFADRVDEEGIERIVAGAIRDRVEAERKRMELDIVNQFKNSTLGDLVDQGPFKEWLKDYTGADIEDVRTVGRMLREVQRLTGDKRLGDALKELDDMGELLEHLRNVNADDVAQAIVKRLRDAPDKQQESTAESDPGKKEADTEAHAGVDRAEAPEQTARAEEPDQQEPRDPGMAEGIGQHGPEKPTGGEPSPEETAPRGEPSDTTVAGADDGLFRGPPSEDETAQYPEGSMVIDDDGVEYVRVPDGWEETGRRYEPMTREQKEEWIKQAQANLAGAGNEAEQEPPTVAESEPPMVAEPETPAVAKTPPKPGASKPEATKPSVPPRKPRAPQTMICPRCNREGPYVSNTPLCLPCTPPVMSDYGTYYGSGGKSGGRDKAFHDMLPPGTREQIEKNQDRVRKQFERAGPHKGGVAPPSGERIRVPPRSGAR